MLIYVCVCGSIASALDQYFIVPTKWIFASAQIINHSSALNVTQTSTPSLVWFVASLSIILLIVTFCSITAFIETIYVGVGVATVCLCTFILLWCSMKVVLSCKSSCHLCLRFKGSEIYYRIALGTVLTNSTFFKALDI